MANSTPDEIRQFILDNFLPGEDPKNLTDDTELTVDHTELEDARWFTRAEVAEAMDKGQDSTSFVAPLLTSSPSGAVSTPQRGLMVVAPSYSTKSPVLPPGREVPGM